MLSGKRFQLRAQTLGIEPVDSDVHTGPPRTTIQIPANEIITILSGPRPEDQRLVVEAIKN
jgi:hypothetical protein